MPAWIRYAGLAALAIAVVAAVAVGRFVALSADYDPGEPLSVPDRAVVYAGHATMVAGGVAAGYTEVAQEAFYLHVPGSGSRTWHSDFPSESPRVQDQLTRIRRALRQGQSSASAQVVWRSYTPENQRFGLALNPLDVTGRREGNQVVYRAVVECSYPRKARIDLPILGGLSIPLEEGLYRALERAGWLHPYDAVWTWTGPLRPGAAS
jgi:hypothetical protein